MSEANYEGSSKVNPDKHKVNGRSIQGWVIQQVTAAGERIRRSIELYRPDRLQPGQEARPLVLGDDLQGGVPKPAPPADPEPPKAQHLSSEPVNPKLQELKRTCKINRNQGAKTIDIDYVLSCLE